MKFSKYLKSQMDASGLNREEFAKSIGISRPTLNSYLSGDSSPTIEKAVDIVNVAGKRIAVVEDISNKKCLE